MGQHSKHSFLSSPSLSSPPVAAGPRIRAVTEDDEYYPEYPWIEGVERLEQYKPGGYHPVMIGDLLHQRYRIVNKLGFGGYSTIWLAQDIRLSCYVAVKVGISSWLPHEIKALQVLSTSSSSHLGKSLIPSVLDTFEMHGPNGTHPCYTTDIARCSLERASFCCLFSLEVTRALVYGLTMAVAYTHSQGYAHGDIHPQNILFKLPSFDTLFIDQIYEKYGKPEIVTIERKKRGPLSYNLPSKAVVSQDFGKDAEEFTLAETNILLSDFDEAFAPATTTREGKKCHTSSNELVSQHIDALGPMPIDWWNSWEKRSNFFRKNGAPVDGRQVWPPLDEWFEVAVQKYRRDDGIGEFDKDEAAAILNILRSMLSYRPEQRPTAQEVLDSEWMVKWGLPCFERSLREQ